MVDVAIIVSLGLAETVLNNVEVDMSVVNVVNWLFEGDLGEKVKFRQAERQYKRWVTTFVQQKPYCKLLWRPLHDGSEAIQRAKACLQAT